MASVVNEPMDDELRSRYRYILEKLRRSNMLSSDEFSGKISPYTNLPVYGSEQYDEYLRQYAMSLAYRWKMAELEKIRCAEIETLRIQLHNAEQKLAVICSDYEAERRKKRRISGFMIVVVLSLLFVLFSLSGWRSVSYDAGYAAAASEVESAKEAFGKEQYDAGYAFGYQSGIASVPASTPSSSFSSPPASRSAAPSSGWDFPEPETDSSYYIGNKNSKKFHYPSCSYLPDEKNRIIFNARSDAVGAGYSPCGRCNP